MNYCGRFTSVSVSQHIVGYFELLRRSLRAATRPAVLEHIRPAFKVFVEGLDLRDKRHDLDISRVRTIRSCASLTHGNWGVYYTQVESATITAFVELVAKLNDTAFRPLFRRLFDWAFQGIVFFFFFSAMLIHECRS